MLGLRRTEGLDIAALNQRFGIDFWQRYGQALQPFLQAGHLRWSSPQLRLSPAGMLLSNLILETFFDDAGMAG
jgi:coproporphyrinogen III oxidase-like Fe-S oxidoreductase